MKDYYKPLEHTADLAVRVYGKTPEDLFINAARTLYDVMLKTIPASCFLSPISFNIQANDYEELLVNWLNEVLFCFQTEKIICAEFSIKKLTSRELAVEAKSKTVENNQNFIKTEIKSVTFHNVAIEKEKGLYKTDLILDT